MKPYRLPRSQILAGACVLVLAGLAPAAAQFPPAPGEQANPGGVFPPPPGTQPSSPFPPAQRQAPAQRQDPSFPPPPTPGQASAPSSFPPSSGGFARPSAGGSEAQKVCLTFPSLREDVEKGAAAIKAAGDRKATREQVCPLFKSFAAKEAKMVKFLETNRVLCGVPANVIPQVKGNHAKTIQIRNPVCSAGPVGGGAPAAPTLSDALGGPIIADDNNVKPGRGTFDTLTGNALQR